MLFLKFVHIAFMFAGVALALGGGAVVALIARSGDVRSIRSAFGVMTRFLPLIPTFFSLGLVFGLATALTGGFDFFRPWLLIAYGLYIAASIVGGVIEPAWHKRVLAAAMASPDDAPSHELLALVADRRAEVAFGADVVLMSALIFDMVVKPFGA